MKKGFTLVELLIVVAIIGVLAGLAVPQYLGTIEKAKGGIAKNALGIIAKAEKMYYAEHGSYITVGNNQLQNILGVYVEMNQIQNDSNWDYRVLSRDEGRQFIIVATRQGVEAGRMGFISLDQNGVWNEGSGEGPAE